MKLLISLALLALSTASFSQVRSSTEIVKLVETFQGKTGAGSFSKNGKVTESKQSCYVNVENIDIWNSEYTVTADIMEMIVGREKLGTDLQSWDVTKVVTSKMANGTVVYRYAFTAENKCTYTEVLKVKKNKLLRFELSKKCTNGKASIQIATCKY